MHIRLIALSVAVCALAVPGVASAESEVGLWLEAGLRHRVSKKLRLSFDQHLRFDKDVSEVESVMPEIGLTYRAHKRVRLSLGYRLTYKPNRNVEWRHRLHADARVRHRMGKLRLGYRLRLQDTLRGGDGSDGSEYVIRNRVSLLRPLDKKTTPGLSVELFHVVGDGDPRMDKLRLTAGVSREFGDKELDVFYRIETLHDAADAPTAHIIGVGFSMPI